MRTAQSRQAKPSAQPDEDPRLATEHEESSERQEVPTPTPLGRRTGCGSGCSHVVRCHAVTSFAVGLGLVEDRVAPTHGTKSVRQLCGPSAIYSPLCRRICRQFGIPTFFCGCRTRVFLSIPSAWKVSTGSVLLATQKDYFWAFPTAGVATCSTHPTSARSGATEGTPWGGGEAAERRPAPGITGVLHRGPRA